MTQKIKEDRNLIKMVAVVHMLNSYEIHKTTAHVTLALDICL